MTDLLKVLEDDAALVIDALPHGPHTAGQEVTKHGRSELSNSVPTIMETVSHWDQHFALLLETDDGGLELRLETDLQGVEKFYVERVESLLLEASHRMKRVLFPWYSLTEAIGAYRWMGTDEREYTHVVVLFPTWTDGIIGEIMWQPQFSNPKPDWNVAADVADKLDEFETAWLSGDVDSMLGHIAEQTVSVIRVVDVEGTHRELEVVESKPELASNWNDGERIVDMRMTNRVVTQFYAFSSYRLLLEHDGRQTERELARLLPVNSAGEFVGELSYAFQVPIL